ncbi:MAG: peptidylprolyl isomerase [Phycisphaerales bacterium]
MPCIRKRLYAAAAASVVFVSTCLPAPASTIVRIQHNLGTNGGLNNTVYIELFDDTPATRDNFLNYVNSGAYNNVVMHRSVYGFVLQGGGFTFDSALQQFNHIATDPPVVNEFGRSNLYGTIAMAKVGGDPDSATSEFFYNLNDNSENLDNQNGGFTVFARVLGNGMDLISAFATIPTTSYQGFTNLPVNNNTLLVMNDVSVVQLRIGDTDFDGDIDQDDADLLTTTLVGGSDEPQYDVDRNGLVQQADLDLLNALLMGDLDGDGFVGIADLNMVLGHWNQTTPPGGTNGDPSNDGFVGIEDLNAVLGAWNVGTPLPPASSAVPEPTSLALLGMGTLLVVRRKH